MQIKRRLVVYVQGYDPRGVAEYYRMFRREYGRSCELYGLTGKVGRAENDPASFITTWDVHTEGDGWHVDTRYVFLRWEDIIRKDFARPAWWKVVYMCLNYPVTLFNGVVPRIAKAHWRFGLFTLYPFVLMTLWCALGAISGFLIAKLGTSFGAPALLAGFLGTGAGLAVFAGLLRFTEPQTYLLYLCDDIVSTYQYARRRRPDWEERMELFAGHVVETIRASDADEAVIVGHSSGSFLAVDVLDRALTKDAELGRHRPRVALLTIGANLPIVGFHKQAQWFRDRLRRLAVAPDIAWVDYQSRHDIMNFWPFDPITGHGIALGAERRNPKVVAISFRDLWPPAEFARRRWRFFRAHFQFLHANERLGAAYDYYLICCGPFDLVTRAGKPAEVAAAMTGGAQAAEPKAAP